MHCNIKIIARNKNQPVAGQETKSRRKYKQKQMENKCNGVSSKIEVAKK